MSEERKRQLGSEIYQRLRRLSDEARYVAERAPGPAQFDREAVLCDLLRLRADVEALLVLAEAFPRF